ncbi:MAG: L-glyceraldehyde 3-phosphate reductase [Thermoleophilaceae bacterium]
MNYLAARTRYDSMPYRRCGRSGLQLPAISVGLWNNFGDDHPLETQRAVLRQAFDRGVTHFDLANNYGPPPGSAETNFGRIFREDFRPYRDELIISTKAGYDMWAGPYGEWGSRKYLLASLDQSLQRMGLDYVDIFYSHRFDPDTPLEETLGAVATAVQQGKALYAGISSYSGPKTAEAVRILRDLGTPLLIHQPSYSLLNRWIEEDLLDVLEREGVGSIVFSPLAQGMLTDKYLDGIPEDSRAAKDGFLKKSFLSEDNLARIRGLREIAERRGQSLPQMAIAWVLRDPRVTSALIGVRTVGQLEDSLRALERLDFSDDDLAAIEQYAVDSGVNIWAESSRY